MPPSAIPNPPAPSVGGHSPIPEVWVARGQCIEHYGAGEAYGPLLEAVSGLCRQADGAQVLDVLRRVAPTWVVQLPALLTEADYAALQPKVAGATRERMLREMVEALEMLSAERLLVLVLEDVHWSDASTTDLLNLVARRRERARLLVVATYRPAEVIISEHPLKRMKQELVTRGQGVEVMLGPLGADSVQQYVGQQWATAARNPAAAAAVYRRTEGHPLFMVQVIDYLAQHDKAEVWKTETLDEVEHLIPQQLRELLEVQVGQLTAEEQQVLEVGSVAGTEFTIASVAAGMGSGEEEIEAVCERLAQRGQFIAERELEPWPDGTVSGRYGFRHALYQEVLYQRLSGSRRARLHRQIGERQEAGYRGRTREIAAELAMHFEHGRDYERAVRYLQAAAENALRQSAYSEAMTLLARALEFLKTEPEIPEHNQRELTLLMMLGTVLMSTKGFTAPEVEQVYSRARTLCQQLAEVEQQLPVLRGLWTFDFVRGSIRTAYDLAQQALHLAQRQADSLFVLEAHQSMGHTLFLGGDLLSAQSHLAQSMASYDPRRLQRHILMYGRDPQVVSFVYEALILAWCGYPEQAYRRCQAAQARAEEIQHPFSQIYALVFSSWVAQFLRDRETAHTLSEASIALSSDQGFRHWQMRAEQVLGWSQITRMDEAMDISPLRSGRWMRQALASGSWITFQYALMAEAYWELGQPEAGLALVNEGLTLVDNRGERLYAAELWRLKGELTLQQLKMKNGELKITRAKGEKSRQSSALPGQSSTPSTQAEAEEYFLTAIDIARHQHAKSLELRAVMSLARLRQCQTTHPAPRTALAEAHQMLSEVYHWFTEGFDTQDLQEARTLLEEVS